MIQARLRIELRARWPIDTQLAAGVFVHFAPVGDKIAPKAFDSVRGGEMQSQTEHIGRGYHGAGRVSSSTFSGPPKHQHTYAPMHFGHI